MVQCHFFRTLLTSMVFAKGSRSMGRNGGVTGMGNGTNGTGKQAVPGASQRSARRIVLLSGDEHGEVSRVLLEMKADEISGRRLHAEVQRLAQEHAGTIVAAEWLSTLGWTRFLWCRK
jgi:hypothetical protein